MKRTLLLTLLLASIVNGVWASFSYTYGGQTLYYNITSTSPRTVEVGRQYSISGAVIIPSSVTYSGNSYTVTSIGESAFGSCHGLTSIIIPNSVTSIGTRAFYNCSSLTSITIPNSVTRIGEYAFLDCSGLTSVTIGNSVTSIGAYAFKGCSHLTSATIPNSVTDIEAYAFRDCSSLTSVSIGNSVTSIGDGAFYNCSSITSITIPNSVTSIGSYAFYNCSSLSSVSIGNSVTSVRERTFSNCSNLTSVTIGNSVDSIGANAFYYCLGLTRVDYTGSIADWCNILFADCYANPLYYSPLLFINNSIITNLVVPNSVTSIGNYAFNGCSSLTSVTIPNSVTNIGDMAFHRCSSLTSVTIGNSVTSIGGAAFGNCSNLTSVTIGNSVTRIGINAFNRCYDLTSVTIPNSVTSIGDYAFELCSSLNSVTIGNSVDSIGAYAFDRCYDLTSVTIPNSVTSIGHRAFAECSGLTSVTIGNSVTSIESYAFSLCSGLTSVYMRGTTPPSISNDIFPLTNRYIYVPCSALSAYQNSTWNEMNLIAKSPTVIVNTSNNLYGTASILSSSCTDATIQATANTGYRLIHWSDNDTHSLRSFTLSAYDTINLTAYFESMPGWYDVIAQTSSSSQGNVSGGGHLQGNTATTITATANAHYHFDHWQDGNTSNPRTITITGNATYTAYFAIDQHTITLAPNDDSLGTVSGGGSFDYGSQTQISATATAYHYHFARWSDGNSSNPRTITINGDTSFTAIFEIDQHHITVTSNNDSQGSVSGSGTFDYGSSTTLTATANAHYHFDHWQDGNTSNPRNITVSGNATYTAYFAIDQHTVTLTPNDASLGTVSGGGSFDYGSQTQISATATAGHYHFARWSDGNSSNPRTITINGDTSFTAIFEIDQHHITVTSNNDSQGSVSGNGTFDYGSSTTLTATANTHYHFDHWQDGNTSNPRTITVTGNATYTAYFAIDQHTVTLTTNDASLGTVSGGGLFDYGSQTQISATATADHYHFARWSDGNSNNPRTITINGDTSFTAIFEIDQHQITVTSNNNSQGSVSGSGTFDYGTSTTLTATANTHYHFNHWQDGNTSNPRTITITGNATYTAYFAIDQHTITLAPNDASLGTVSGGGTFDYGTQTQISATVTADHYHFARWSDGNTSNPRTITVSSDLSLTAIFEIDHHTITATSENSTMGSVTGAGSYEYGSTATLTATPRAGYQFVRWSDGSDDNPYSILVTADATYTAHFIRNTGIEDAETNGVVITAQDGKIVCNGCQGKVIAIYDQIGRTILPPTRHIEDRLICPIIHTGIYIVRINNTTSLKVLVR